MRRRRSKCILLVSLMLAIPGTVGAAQITAPDPAAVQAAIAEAKARLKLTPEQEAQIRPLVAERTEKLKAIRDNHAGDTSRRAKREMYREARPVLDDYQDKVRAILTDEQEAEWEKMRSEATERLKERYRAGQGPD